ncbi:MAG: tRNA (N6-isopentenyl adenosine(37)-C2)-methylthiotransferase MiaB [Candidatus Glassbacteria bacterium]|nr:tRNA (N6-isopentenyl adenosine(37)-C2)-methylthiotransferase MiaB [Candidatus Glassbacteria bacterium]
MTGPKTYYLESYGCQMNFSDSELIETLLSEQGLGRAAGESEADLILINTCSVRAHAEQRVMGRLRALKKLKDRRPEILLGVCGCMAQRMGEDLLRELPWVDLVVGPDSYRRLPGLVSRAGRDNPVQAAELVLDRAETYHGILPRRRDEVSAWVPITRGCDNFCSYCIVPYVRGRERSLEPEAVERQVALAVEGGAREVVLLGQNVNSYRSGPTGFAGLLRRLESVPGLARVRFLTSHPRDLSDEIVEAMAGCGKVCEHLHLPVQSGSDRVLEAMNRGYTRDYYLDRVRLLRSRVPGLSLTTDILVGFPGETAEDFGRTVSLMKQVCFDYAYTFRYSPRPGTAAAGLEDSVPEQEKKRRLQQVIDLQLAHTRAALDSMVGAEVEAMVVKPARSGQGKYLARTRGHFSVILPAESSQVGRVVRTVVTAHTGMSLVAGAGCDT